ncbi:hypothetical protein F5Y12DRAFT_464007 [Xylaria sp. FL1777]|nr:hypothetical protein F5Y12DRAFT_464007 [Xylaria sp. FL1777]
MGASDTAGTPSSEDEGASKSQSHRSWLLTEELIIELSQADLKSEVLKEKYKTKIRPIITDLEKSDRAAGFINDVMERNVVKIDGKATWISREWKAFLLEIAIPLNWDQLGYQTPKTGNSQTSLHRAIVQDKKDRDDRIEEEPHFMSLFCDLMERGMQDSGTLSKEAAAAIIAKVNENKENCLHLALVEDLDLAERLILMADEATFLRQRSNGNTPLHDALNFPLDKNRAKNSTHPYLIPARICECERCQADNENHERLRARRFKIIGEMLRKCSLALAVHNHKGMSPLRHHLMGREEFRKTYKDFNTKPKKGTGSKVLVWLNQSTQGGVMRANTGSPREPRGSECLSNQPQNYYQLSDDIEKLLWEEAFRIKGGRDGSEDGGFEKACQCLFLSSAYQGTNAESSDNDDEASGYSPSNRIFTPTGRITTDTVRFYKHWKFEPTMTYVHLKLTPNYETDGVPENWAKWSEDSSKGLKKVFKWLTGSKGVKRILKLVVEDNAEWPCSEEIIKSCLESLNDVRYLNWKRPNISAETLHKAPNVVELWLYSTGINAVLSSWADEEGLRKLKKLRVVRLDARMGYETESANERNVDKFKKKLLKGYENLEGTEQPSVEFTCEKTVSGNQKFQTGGGALDLIPSNPWLQKMLTLTEALSNEIPLGEDDSSDEMEAPNSNYFVKIALLDDGVSPEGFLGKFMSGVGWPIASEPKGDEAPSAPFYSTGQEKHGNRMARLITAACPFVRLDVAKMSALSGPGAGVPHPSFRFDDAGKAINWAIKQKVDIICMSWNMWLSEEDATPLKKVVRKAYDKKILMFCAASENKPTGSMNAKAWPTGCVETFSIGAASNTRVAKDYVGPEAQYLFPSEGVLTDTKDGGSSAATALAAGLAALILFSLKNVNRGEEENAGRKEKWASERSNMDLVGLKQPPVARIEPHETVSNVFTSLTRRGDRYVDIDALVKAPSFKTIAEYCKTHVAKSKKDVPVEMSGRDLR